MRHADFRCATAISTDDSAVPSHAFPESVMGTARFPGSRHYQQKPLIAEEHATASKAGQGQAGRAVKSSRQLSGIGGPR